MQASRWSLEQHHDLEAAVVHPILQPDEFMLQLEQRLVINAPIERLALADTSSNNLSSRASSSSISSSSSKLSASSSLIRARSDSYRFMS